MDGILLTKNLMLMNSGNVPTFVASGRNAQSIIDLTIVNSSMLQNLKLTDWEVSVEQPSFSDHRYIFFKLGKYIPKCEEYRNLKRGDWDTFASLLKPEELPLVEWNGSNLDACAEELEDMIQEALDIACPLKKAVPRAPNPWWNRELDELHAILKETHKAYTDHPESEARVGDWKEARRRFRYAVKRAKKESWQEYCTEAETAKDLSKVIKNLKPKATRGISLFKKQGKVLTPKETLNNLMDEHLLDSVSIEDGEVEASSRGPFEDNGTSHFFEYLDEYKVAEALK